MLTPETWASGKPVKLHDIARASHNLPTRD